MAGHMPRGRFARGAKLGGLAASRAVRGVSTKMSVLGRTEQARQRLTERSAIVAAQQLVTVLGEMKGAAMKVGQMLSALELDLVPEPHREQFRAKLVELCDRAPTVAFADMRAVLEGDLGRLATVFTQFDETPIAAASIGQVYRAQLRDGRWVAVKVKYPGVDEAVSADMRNLMFLSRLLKNVLPSAADKSVIGEVVETIGRELDYQREATAQHRVATRYRGHPFITVPAVIGEYCGPNVLVTELIDGHSFDRIRQLPAADRDGLGELIYRFYISALFADHEYCGDPHRGNILLGRDGKLGFVDFGLYNSIDDADVELERAVIRAAAEGRAQDVCDMWVRRGILDPDAGVSPWECLDYVMAVAGWHLVDEPMTITTELATSAVVLAVDPRVMAHRGMRHQLLPPEHVFSRRTDLFTLGVLGQLEATANWHTLAAEWLYGEPATTDIGRAIESWKATRLR
ncbi:ABC1 kinase family protein [Nocardia sp. NPDC055049]